MKIAFYCPNKPLSSPNPSGDLIIARGIHEALNGQGHDCKEIATFRSRWFWKSLGGWRSYAIAFTRALKRSIHFRPDIWLTYHTYYKSPDVIGPAISRILSIPYVLFQPMYETKWRKERQTAPGFYLNRIALKSARLAIGNNLDDLQSLRRVIAPEDIIYLPPGIYVDDFKKDRDAGTRIRQEYGIPEGLPILFTAARFRPGVKFRSLEYLFNALAALRARKVEFVLLIAGDGPLEGELRQAADAMVPGRVIFLGRVAREAICQYYSAADLFVFPGIGESLGMVYLEAQACELPVVALQTTGVVQVVRNGETGLLAPEDDGTAMARAIETLLVDVDARERLSANAQRFVAEERNLSRNYLRLSSILEAVCRPGKSA